MRKIILLSEVDVKIEHVLVKINKGDVDGVRVGSILPAITETPPITGVCGAPRTECCQIVAVYIVTGEACIE